MAGDGINREGLERYDTNGKPIRQGFYWDSKEQLWYTHQAVWENHWAYWVLETVGKTKTWPTEQKDFDNLHPLRDESAKKIMEERQKWFEKASEHYKKTRERKDLAISVS